LAIELSKLEPHPCNSVELEQYVTEGDLAAFWLLAVDQLDDLENKSVLDLGSGNGILGLGAAYLGANEILLIEADHDAHEVSKNNIAKVNQKFDIKINSIKAMIGIDDIELSKKYDIIIMNPPWGFQTEKADRPLLEFSFGLNADSIYVLHSAKEKHLQAMAKDFGYDGEIVFETDFRLPAKYSHHVKKSSMTEARCWRFHRTGDKKIISE
tara:strand:+ start:361 stop:993 length:633 start_codon:yes stop_codon:yes gene_type:complete